MRITAIRPLISVSQSKVALGERADIRWRDSATGPFLSFRLLQGVGAFR